ncbi:glycosyl hydrolase family 43 [Flavimobilis soli]|uniref:Glycosyl hydrolase family 43 n=1 Tax=Flavimobilis soli TaxID=442709 RepID=A0A2A9EDA1_9MICO|nr:immunoglobulin-like domain-containing protein [Flavimobilis soli]PFG36521.1 glycosyl hydrolase family 43 [Flavimobilis soli]
MTARLNRPPSRTGRAIAWSAIAALTFTGLAAMPAQAADPEPVPDGMVAWYKLDETAGTVAADSSGNDNDATVTGAAAWTGGDGFTFSGGASSGGNAIKMPDNILAGLDSVTVATDVWVDPALQGNHFIYNFGNEAVGTPQSGNGYFFTTAFPYRVALSPAAWGGEQVTSKGTPLTQGVWKHIAYTQTGTTGILYEDGVEVARKTDVTITPGSIGGGVTTRNFLGRSAYDADGSFKGVLRDFRVYDHALPADDVAELAERVIDDVLDDAAASLDLGDLTAVATDLTLPTLADGVAVSWSSDKPDVISPTGRVTRPDPADDPVDVVLTATLTKGTATKTRTFTATVLPDVTPAEKAAWDAENVALVAPGDVRGNITLPQTGPLGSSITWTSSDADVVTTTGEVTRPAYGEDDVVVTLTARATNGAESATFAHRLTVKAAPRAVPTQGYVFSYFTGNSIAGEKIYLAASRGNDALRWDELNDGTPVLESTKGTRGLRDPFLIRSPEGDRWYLIATDLSIGRNGDWDAAQRHGSQHIEVWESTDLVTWSEQRHVKVSPDNAGNTWAPEAYWDDELGAYVVFWASKLFADDDPNHTGNQHNRMMYATTRDFVTFSEAQVWQDSGKSLIDSTVIKEDGWYHRFTKDEGSASGCVDIIQERSRTLTAPLSQWEHVTDCIGQKARTGALEGPTIFKANEGDVNGGGYYLFVDEYGGRGFIPMHSDSLDEPDWVIPTPYSLPTSPRHGTVAPVTKAELDAVRGNPATAVTSTTRLTLAPAPAGTASRADVTVTASDAGQVAGSVRVTVDEVWSTTARLVDGKASVSLPDTLRAGTADVVAEYLGYDVVAASSTSGTLVVPAPADTTPPVTSATVDAKARTVTLRSADGGSGVDRVEYRLVVGSTVGAWTRYTGPVKVGSGETTVQFRAVDRAGNVEPVGSVVVPRAGVVLAPSATVAVVSPAKVAVGKVASVRVRVSGAGGAASGQVRVLDGSRVVGAATLKNGGATVRLVKDLAVGRRTLTVSYGGDSRFAGSSDMVVVTVVKASSKVSVKVTPKKVTVRSKAKVAVTVISAGSRAGKVSVKVTSKVKGKNRTVVTRTVNVGAKGKGSVTLPRLAKGTYKVTVTFKGSSSASTSTRTTNLTVRR